MKSKFSVLLNIVLGLFVISMLSSQAVLNRRVKVLEDCLNVGSFCVIPSADDAATNTFAVYDWTGTNYFAVDKTNSTLRIGIGGTNVTGLSSNVNPVTVASNKNLIFVNGILTKVE